MISMQELFLGMKGSYNYNNILFILFLLNKLCIPGIILGYVAHRMIKISCVKSVPRFTGLYILADIIQNYVFFILESFGIDVIKSIRCQGGVIYLATIFLFSIIFALIFFVIRVFVTTKLYLLFFDNTADKTMLYKVFIYGYLFGWMGYLLGIGFLMFCEIIIGTV